MADEITRESAPVSPAAMDLLIAIERSAPSYAGVLPRHIRDERGSGWPANAKRAGLLGVLVREGLIRRLPGSGKYTTTRAGRKAVGRPTPRERADA